MASFKDRASLAAFSESYQQNALNELDQEFYRLAQDLSATRVRFIRQNPGLFRARRSGG
jgi:hypothetical protein